MKIKRLIPLFAIMLFACGQNEKTTSTQTEGSDKSTTSSSGNNAITFKVEGQQVNSEGWVVQRFVWDEKTPAPWLNITSNMHKDKRSINVNLNATNPASYSFSENASLMSSSHGSYFPDFSKPLESYSFVSGEFNITEVDTAKGIVNGTFSGTGKDVNGKTVIISEGKLINLKLKSGVTNISKGFEAISQ